MINKLRCCATGCNRWARWHVWFAGYGWPYTSVCDRHAVQYLLNGKNGWPASQIDLVGRNFLKDNDWAAIKLDEEESRKKCE